MTLEKCFETLDPFLFMLHHFQKYHAQKRWINAEAAEISHVLTRDSKSYSFNNDLLVKARVICTTFVYPGVTASEK